MGLIDPKPHKTCMNELILSLCGVKVLFPGEKVTLYPMEMLIFGGQKSGWGVQK